MIYNIYLYVYINENTKTIKIKYLKSTTACFAKDGSSGGILFNKHLVVQNLKIA